MRNINTILTGIILTAVAIQSGCTAPQRSGALTTHTFMTADSQQRDELWRACTETLRENRFKLDQVDQRAGVITTLPETSKQFFEFWRKDARTCHDFWESSLRTVRRSAKIEINFDSETDLTKACIQVNRERFATPERQFNNSIAALRVFRNELPSAQTGQPLTDADSYWIADGRDPAMENYLLNEIITRLGQ